MVPTLQNPQPKIEENKKEEEKVAPREPRPPKQKVERRPSVDLDNLDPNTFTEKFKGFEKGDYEDVEKVNADFFSIGYLKYIQMVQQGKYCRSSELLLAKSHPFVVYLLLALNSVIHPQYV